MDLKQMNLDELKKVFVETVLPKIKEGWETAKEKLFGENGILDEIKNNPKEFFDAAKLAAKLDFYFEEVEMLTVEKIVEISKQHMAANSNEVVAYKTLEKDTFKVYLAYATDRELLPEEENHYVVIEADGLSKDVKELFSESDVVILK